MRDQLGHVVPPTDANLNSISLEYSFDDVSRACRNFSQACLLGKGSYGAVYRGVLKDGTEVAVKALSNPKDSGFKEEVQVLSKFRHPNLVILMGFSRNGKDRYLIYELLPGGDLCSRLQRDPAFDWRKRMTALLDSALGLSHLHNASPKVFHRDIKTQNILLDRNGIAKMADFGLALLCLPRQGLRVEQCSGTIGYADPLYISSSVVTEKSEVYSLGMVVLECLTGQPPATQHPVTGQIQYVYSHIRGDVRPVMQMVQWRAGWPPEMAQRMARLAIACIDRTEVNRPVFVDIVARLRDLVNRTVFSNSIPVAPPMNIAPTPIVRNQMQLEEAFRKLQAPPENVNPGNGKWNPFELSEEEVQEQLNEVKELVKETPKDTVKEEVSKPVVTGHVLQVPDASPTQETAILDNLVHKAVADFDEELRAMTTRTEAEDVDRAMNALFPSSTSTVPGTPPNEEESSELRSRREIAKHLLSAGFSLQQTREALKRTTSVEAAVEWIVEQNWE
jgi:serine/threonine protein kinase